MKVIELSDEQYRTIERAAEARGQTPGALLARPIEEWRDPHIDPRHYETDDWLRQLGVSEEMVEEANMHLAARAPEIDKPRDPHTDPRYYETEDWLRHLGATEEQIAESASLIPRESRIRCAHGCAA